MSDEKRPVPTGPGWWWRSDVGAVIVADDGTYGFTHDAESREHNVEDDGFWIAPVLTPAEAGVLRERAESAERHLGSLLARIHRDGGHREALVGAEAAVAEADDIVAALYARDAKRAAEAEARRLGLLKDEP